MDKQGERQRKQSPAYLQKVANWVLLLATHFSQPQDEDQVRVFTDGLARHSDFQIDTAFQRALHECEFMPRLRDLHMRMPEEREERKITAMSLQMPMNEVVRPYAEKAAQGLFQKNLQELSGKDLAQAFFEGNRARYKDLGIDVSRWPKS